MKYTLKSTRPAPPPFDLTRDLNPQQRAVVEAPAGKILVLAGAGTGKTRTLTYRVARFVAGGCPPERLMLVTFTNRAGREMVSRVEGLLGVDMRRSEAGTFHHVGNRILRKHGTAIGMRPDFGILDPEDTADLLGAVIAELGLATLTAKRFPSPKLVASMIGMSKGTLVDLGKVVDDRYPRFAELLPALLRIERRFAERKRELNVVDFDDLLSCWLDLLRKPEARATAALIRESYSHLLVDEYQDINALQGALVDEMAAGHGSLTCVGDDAQSIYSFRGADFEQIHLFRRRHPDASVLPLTINYRSTPQILDLANRSIRFNEDQHPKKLSAVRNAGTMPALIPLRDVYQQAELVAQRVLELHHEQNLPLRKMAVLYRNHAHSLELQVELTRRQIPYSVRSGVRFFEQAHIKDVVSYLRARENPRDTLAWMRLLRLWPGIGHATAERVGRALAGDAPTHPEADAPTLTGSTRASDVLRDQAATIRGRAGTALKRLASLWDALTEPSRENPGDAILHVLKAHYGDHVERTWDNSDARREDIENLAGFAARYPSATEFLAELALAHGISAEQVISGEEPDDKLILSTIHQAKGLEWPIVFVLWLADGRFPTAQSMRSRRDLEEERRLFYVATTRAGDDLHLLFPTVEEGRDGPSRLLRPSRFVSELDTKPPVFERWEIEETPPDDG